MKVKMLPAFYGDCFLVEIPRGTGNFNMLVDGGIGRTYPLFLRKEILAIYERGEDIDLLVITHIDDDHIGGILKLFGDAEIDKSRIRQIWFNSGTLINSCFKHPVDKERELPLTDSDDRLLSVTQGNTLETRLRGLASWHQQVVKAGDIFHFGEIKISILSPSQASLEALEKTWEIETYTDRDLSGKTETDYDQSIPALAAKPFSEDKGIPNGSSIAFLLEAAGAAVLFLADAHPEVIADSLGALGFHKGKRLVADLVKVAHHGSRGNTSPALLDIIESKRFAISTNGARHELPHKEALARIIERFPGSMFYFNYPELPGIIFQEGEPEEYHFSTVDLSKGKFIIEL